MKSTESIKNILVVRNDKIGDFILCLPSLHLLRACYPNAKITMIVSHMTEKLARSLTHLIDDIIVDVGKKAPKSEINQMIAKIKSYHFDASISLFSHFHMARCLYKAGIKHRLAPKTKIAQIFYNHKIIQRRSQSIQAEYLYNLELIDAFIKIFPGSVDPKTVNLKTPYLQFDTNQVSEIKAKFMAKHRIKKNQKLIFIHPGHGGSAENLSLKQYTELANHLIGQSFYLVISAGPNELELAQKLSQGLTSKNHCILHESNLITYAKHLQFADLMICGGTGPLHLAAALNCNTCGFFPRTPVVSSTRWRPINDVEKQLTILPKSNYAKNDMASINTKQTAIEISKLFLMI